MTSTNTDTQSVPASSPAPPHTPTVVFARPTKLKAKDPEIVQPGKTKALIYGASGVGKTWFTMSFPTPYFIDTEGGADLLHYQKRLKEANGAYFGPADGALDFDTVIDQMKALATEKHPFKTLIIDSITKLYQTAIADASDRLGDKDVFGASKKPAIAGMRRVVNWAARLDMNVWFVAHETNEWGMDPKTGQRAEVGKMSDVWDKLIYELDLTLQAVKRGPDRNAIVRKSRLIGFPDLANFPLDYAEFATRYGKDFIEAAPVAIVLASAEQVAEIKRLLDVVKIDDTEAVKVLTKAGADDWTELNTAQADAVIKWLGKKISGK